MVANLTILQRQRQGDPGFVEYIITNAEANEKFTISENGLLHTKVKYLLLLLLNRVLIFETQLIYLYGVENKHSLDYRLLWIEKRATNMMF